MTESIKNLKFEKSKQYALMIKIAITKFTRLWRNERKYYYIARNQSVLQTDRKVIATYPSCLQSVD